MATPAPLRRQPTRHALTCESARFEPGRLDLAGIVQLLRERLQAQQPSLTLVDDGYNPPHDESNNSLPAVE